MKDSMKISLKLITILLLLLTVTVSSNPQKRSAVKAAKSNQTIIVDGILDEDIWKNSELISGFIQRDPNEGKPASENTEVRIAYDEGAIYIAARMYDSSPDSIVARLARRDDYVEADKFVVYLDPYNDKRSGYFFGLNAAGAYMDGVLFNDDWDDNSWDGVWEGKVELNGSGWTAEFKIPFSQLRFKDADINEWGVNFSRFIARKNERDYYVYVPKNESGFVSHFVSLIGMENIKPGSQFEILPYITTKAEYTHPAANDPFNNGSKYLPGIGADLKMGIGSNLTLNATINPDFGQVEIDPAVINLSDVETFYSEKRPFFVEGSSIFNFGQGGARSYWGFNWSNPDFFYSRRIGKVPEGSLPDNDYADYPAGTHILAASKLTGKLNGNWNVGTIQAVTRREYAEYQYNGSRFETEVEPFTYSGIFRVQKEFDEGFQSLGFISTITQRAFKDDRLRSEINSGGYTFGLDGWSFLDSSKSWVFTGWVGASHITGTSERITEVQRNSRHYFQRPDAKNFGVDSSANSLSGYAMRFYINKQKGNFFMNTAFGLISPGFDVNDAGFMWRADQINAHAGAGYHWTDPTDFYRYLELGGALFSNSDFDGNVNGQGIFHFGSIEFLNYYNMGWNLAYNPETISNRRTRGGPLTSNPSGYQVSLNINSDSRKDIVIGVYGYTYQSDGSRSLEAGTSLEFKPVSNVSISFSPFYSYNLENAQWVTSKEDQYAVNTFGRRYVFAEMKQHTVGAGIRLNWIFNPRLSLQLYVQPLISSGDYYSFKELKRASSYDFLVYGQEGSTFNKDDYTADPDGSGPAGIVEVGNPDFNFKSLRGNAVLRWEYLPGSVLYFVWTQTRSDYEEMGQFQFSKNFNRLMDQKPDNIFMIKFTYWFSM